MNTTEIRDFKKFLNDRNIFMMFSQYYRQNHLMSNPSTLDAYLEKAKAESVIPLAFVYPKSVYGKDFWLAIHEEWNERLGDLRAVRSETEQLTSLGLEIIDIKPKSNCLDCPGTPVR